MNELLLYDKSGVILFTIAPEESSSHDWRLMSENKLSISFEREECSVLAPGCYVEFDGIRYYLLDEYKPRMINSVTWKYDVAFLDAASWMSIVLAMNTLDGKNIPIFNYTGPAREHAAIIVANLNRYMGATEWKLGCVIDTPNITIEYRGKYCSQILQEIVDGQDTEWWVDGMTLNIGRAEFGDAVELGYRNGLLGDISREQVTGQRAYAYLVPIGSTRNIDPTKYGYDRLQLPDGQVFIDINPDGVGELVEERAFAGIYPRYEGTIQYVRSKPATGSDGNEFTIYYIGDMLPFNPNDYEIAGLVKRITFQSGELMGESFEVNYNAEAQEFEIITQFQEDGTQLPGGFRTPEAGDKYVIWNITMPDEYYTLASQEYLEAAEAFAESSLQDASVYKGSLDYINIQERGVSIRPGQRVRLLSKDYFSKGYHDSRVTRMTRRLWYPNEINIDVSAVRVVGSIARLETSVQKAETQISQLSGAQPAIIKSSEQTPASDKSVFSSAKSEQEFLNKRKGDRVTGRVDFDTIPGFPVGAEFNGAILRFDLEKKCWVFPHNLIVEGGVAWNASIAGFEPQTITDAVNVDGVTIGRDGNGALCVIGGSGGGGTADSVAWSNITGKPTWIEATKPSYTWSEISSKPTTIAGYGITDAYTKAEANSAIDTRINALVNGAPAAYDTLKEIADVLAGNVNSIGDIMTTLGTKWTQDNTLIANWNAAYDWGNHADAGYIKGINYSMVSAALGVGLIDANGRNGIPVSSASGYMEVGKALDFHFAENGSDYSVRLRVIADSGTQVNLPTESGTLALAATTLAGYGITDAYTQAASNAKFVDFSSGQTITGLKDFTNGLKIGGALISYDATKNAFVLPANLVVEGGVAWNASIAGFEPQTITEAVNVDGVTIGRDGNGALCVIGGSGGGGTADSVAWSNITGKPTWIEATKPTYTWSEISSRPTALSQFTNDAGYITSSATVANALALGGCGLADANGRNGIPVSSASGYMEVGKALDFHFTENGSEYSVRLRVIADSGTKVSLPTESGTLALVSQIPTNTNQLTNGAGYITSAAIPTKISAFTNDSGYITGVTSSMVTTALGYTPFNATNFTKTNIKSTLGISDWALATSKPSYAYSEISGTPSSLPASDVYAWAKAPTKPTYTWSEISSRPTALSQFTNDAGYITSSATVANALALGGYGLADANGRNGIPVSSASGYMEVGKALDFHFTENGSDYSVRLRVIADSGTKVSLPTESGTLALAATTLAGYGITDAYTQAASNAKFMDFSSEQTITGLKDFTNGLKIGGVLISYDATKNAFVLPANLVVEGGVAWNSSRALKNIVGGAPTYLTLAELRKIRPYRYTWKDGRDNRIHAGGIADEVLEVLPEVIMTDAKGIHSMDYGQVAFTVASSLTPYVSKHEREIKALRLKVKVLERTIEKLTA